MFSKAHIRVLLSISLVTLFKSAAAQTAVTATGELGVEAIEAHFTGAGIVPSLLTAFDPSALLTISYSGVGSLSPGQALTKDQVAPVPQLSLTPANNTVKLGGNYTLVMADAGPVGTDETQGQTRHWLVNGVTLNGTAANLNVTTKTGVAITEYAGPAPAAGSGAHRYVILLYTQPESFTAPAGLDSPDVGVSTFNLADYVKTSGLGAIVAGNYITVEEGTATFTPSATASVVTSTLPAAQSSSASGSGPSSAPSTAPTGTGTNSGVVNGAAIQKTLLAALLGYLLI